MDESLKAQLQATLDMVPAFTWFAGPSGALLFVNSRGADYLGLPQDHPLVIDIKDRKRVEEALRRSEHYLAEAQSLSYTSSWGGNLMSQRSSGQTKPIASSSTTAP